MSMACGRVTSGSRMAAAAWSRLPGGWGGSLVILGEITQRYGDSSGRRSRRGPGRGPASVVIPVPCVRSWHCREASLLVRRVLRTSVLLLIRWFRVRPPGAPRA
jgi:hypothetical protein